MSIMTDVRKPPRSLRLTAGSVLLLWVIYSVVNISLVDDPVVDVLGVLFGGLGLLLLLMVGFSARDCYLRFAPLSRPGLLAYVFVTAGVVGSMLPFFRFRGFDARSLLLYAPASAVAQELFFRAVLLPVLLRIMGRGRARR